MKIELIRQELVTQEIERHYEVNINGKTVYVSKYSKIDEIGQEGNTEIFGGKDKDLLTEDEHEEVIAFVEELGY
jgi:hypothetical protein